MKRILCAVAACALLGAFTNAPLAQDVRFGPAEAEPAPRVSKSERRSEGEQILGSMKGQARVSYAKHGEAPDTLTGKGPAGAGVTKEELEGSFCRVHDKVYRINNEKAALIAEDFAGKDGFCLMRFGWADGRGSTTWYDSLDSLIEANEDVKVEDKKTTSEKKDEAKAVEVTDPWLLYRKEGRNWTHEIAGGMKMKATIKNVTEKGCELETEIFVNGNAIGDPTIAKIEFRTHDPEEGIELPETIEKQIECKAGKFDCISYDGGNVWVHKKYPGLVVKAQSMELIEFNENPDGKDASEAKPDKPADDKGAKEADMDDYWERYVSSFKQGRTWTYELAGGLLMKNEVTEVTETKAILKTTTFMGGNALGDPTENEYDLVQPERGDTEDGEDVKWQEKEIETKAGTFTGVSIDGKTWMMKKYPAIILKAASIELAEFKEE